MTIVEQYWAGVLQRLEAEVNVFAQLVAHEGEKGRENEAVMARILEALVPQRYGIGSGLLIDTHNKYSNQTDIVVFDQSDEPSVLAQTTQLLFPMESVLACIEVKTTLRDSDVKDCIKKAKNMRTKLTPARLQGDGATHPLFVVLAYRSGQRPETIARKFLAAAEAERPDLVCVVEQGLLLGTNACIREASAAPMDGGVALLREDGQPVRGEMTRGMKYVYRGRQYPMLTYGGELLVGDPARGLLLFVEALVRRLADRQARPRPVISYYVDDALRELAWYTADGEPEPTA